MTTTDTTAIWPPITYSGFEGRAARKSIGEKAVVILDPEDRSCSAYTFIGSGVPAKVWHHRAVTIALVAEASLEAVESALRGGESTIEALFALYAGKDWDGSNHVGTWNDPDDTRFVLLEKLESELGEVPTYWDASDYFAPVVVEIAGDVAALVRTGVRPEEAIELIAKKEVDSAEDVILELGDVEDTIRELYIHAVEKVILAADISTVEITKRDLDSILVWIDGQPALAEVAIAALCLDQDATNDGAAAYFEYDSETDASDCPASAQAPA
jgi:hypothetical protein